MCFLAFLPAGCNSDGEYSSDFFAMNTAMSVKIYGGKKSALQLAVKEINRLDKLLDAHSENSEIFKINSGESVELSPETLELVSRALYYCGLTEGALDITVYPLAQLWDITGSSRAVPLQENILKELKKVNYGNVKISGSKVLLSGGSMVDPGAVAKGYAAARAAAALKSSGVKNAVLDLGGDIAILGDNNGKNWRIGLKNPFGEGVFGVLEAGECYIVTSGSYQRFFESGGKRYHHIFDPETGWPADSELVSVTVICCDGTAADALSTALFVMGLQRGLEFLKGCPGVEAVFVTKDKKVTCTPGIKDKLTLADGFK